MKNETKERIWFSAFIICVVLFAGTLACGAYGRVTYRYQYNKEIGTYLDLAYDATSPTMELFYVRKALANDLFTHMGTPTGYWAVWRPLPSNTVFGCYTKLTYAEERLTYIVTFYENPEQLEINRLTLQGELERLHDSVRYWNIQGEMYNAWLYENHPRYFWQFFFMFFGLFLVFGSILSVYLVGDE